jgi:hypothetical protein
MLYLSHVSARRERCHGGQGIAIYLFGLGSLGDLNILVLSKISSVRDYLWLGKILASLTHLIWGNLYCVV